MKFIKFNRVGHKWAGVALSLFLFLISITGIYLIHKDNLPSFMEVKVPGAFIPGSHAKEVRKNRVEIKAILLTEQRWFTGTKELLYESLDKGKSWQVVKRGPFAKGKALETKSIEQSPDGRVIWIGTKHGIYRSFDGGAEWEDMSDILPKGKESRHVSAIAFDPHTSSRLFIGTNKGLYAYDRGATNAIEIKGLFAVAEKIEPQVTLGKYLTDLHTGKLFGDSLWLVYDLVAIAIIFFTGSGIYIWIYPFLIKWRKSRAKGLPSAVDQK